MRRFLDSILAHHERLGRKVLLERLQPGLSPENIKGQLSSIGVSSSNELIDFYGWRNGTRVPPGTPLDDVQFLPGFYLLSLEDAIDSAFRNDERWSSVWLPVFATGGGDFYALDLSLVVKSQEVV